MTIRFDGSRAQASRPAGGCRQCTLRAACRRPSRAGENDRRKGRKRRKLNVGRREGPYKNSVRDAVRPFAVSPKGCTPARRPKRVAETAKTQQFRASGEYRNKGSEVAETAETLVGTPPQLQPAEGAEPCRLQSG